jgi:hypothetical protein
MVSFVLAIFVFSGIVSALEPSAISAYPVLSKQTLNIGSSVTVRITVQSNTDEQLLITHIGINFDWMDSGLFFGPKNNVPLAANDSYTTPPFTVQVPTNVTVGSHTYFVGVDGTEGTSQTDFYWNSTTATIIVLAANQTGTTITPGPTGGGGGGQTASSPLNTILYIAVVAIVVIVVIAVIVMLMQKKRKTTKPSDTPVSEQPAKPADDENYSI